jgi:hypothetical protein
MWGMWRSLMWFNREDAETQSHYANVVNVAFLNVV